MIDSLIRQNIVAAVDARRDECIALLQDLVRFPSVNRPPTGDELECQRFVEAIMRDMSLELDVFQPEEVPGIAQHAGWRSGLNYENRPNVVGIRKGTSCGRSLLLLAHVDVVPEGPHERWRHGPFNPVLEDGQLVGRGSNDDKGGLAALIMALQCVEAAGYQPLGDVILASAVDEESAGANGTLAVLQRGHVADAAVYCDGLDLNVHIASLGGANGTITLQLRPEIPLYDISQIMALLSPLYEELRTIGRERTAILNADDRYKGSEWPEMALRIGYLQAGTTDGGNLGSARIDVGLYFLPGEDPAAVQRELDQLVQIFAQRHGELLQAKVAWNGRVMPPAAISPDEPFVAAVAGCYESAAGQPAVINGMPMSDYFQFVLHSPRLMPTVAMGPGRWNVEGGAHQPNESILIDEHFMPFIKTLALLIADWCGVERAPAANAPRT